MKLLVLTQKVDKNDDLLGFFSDWLRALAASCETVEVICLEKREYDLPENVRVSSLGKEEMKERIFDIFKKIKYILNFYRFVWKLRRDYDAVFVHMNVEYVLLGGWLWRLLGKRIGLWYTHKQVDRKLRWAEKLANVIFTASPESFQLVSKKLKVVGHGIELSRFVFKYPQPQESLSILYVGRISAIKNQKLLIEALDVLINIQKVQDLDLILVGAPVYAEDMQYETELKKIIDKLRLSEIVKFAGSVPFLRMNEYYQKADLVINLCPTGGMDKAVLEAMACGIPVLVNNQTFAPDLLPIDKDMIMENTSAEELAEKILKIRYWNQGKRYQVAHALRQVIEGKYELGGLVSRIIAGLKGN